MPNLVPKPERIPGVAYALTTQGVELPVIDVTHPSFALDQSEAALLRLREKTAADALRWARKPRWLRRLLFSLFFRRSILVRGLHSSRGTFVTGMNTYLLKLSPAHLATSFATKADRRVAASTPLMDVRLRLQIMANLLSDRLNLELSNKAAASAPVFLLNIAGGPAMDSLNALILAHRQPTAALINHPVQIAVLDPNEEGVHFGRNALDALRGPDGPLAGLNATFTHRHYDWNHPESLRDVFSQLPAEAISLGSSEGGLFHYASDEVIRANLALLRECTGPRFSFAGSLSSDNAAGRAAQSFSGAAIRYFKPDAFDALVRDSGWRIDRQVEVLRTVCFLLVKA